MANPIDKSLPDADDNMFLEVALSSKAEVIITGNKKHFPRGICGKIKVVSPREFLEIFLKNKKWEFLKTLVLVIQTVGSYIAPWGVIQAVS